MPETINDIILACCVLHNFLRMDDPIDDNDSSDSEDDKSDSEDDGNNNLIPIPIRARNASVAFDIREKISKWCINEGDLDWQYKMI